jgi:probable rRNA maturation factor
LNRILVSCNGLDEPPWKEGFGDFCGKVLAAMGIDNWEVSLLLCDDDTMERLNSTYRGIDAPTDVLAFRQNGGVCRDTVSPQPVGDVVISVDTMGRQAEELGVPREQELKRLLIHGLLHLSGMDHAEEDTAMMLRQEEILLQLSEERIF